MVEQHADGDLVAARPLHVRRQRIVEREKAVLDELQRHHREDALRDAADEERRFGRRRDHPLGIGIARGGHERLASSLGQGHGERRQSRFDQHLLYLRLQELSAGRITAGCRIAWRLRLRAAAGDSQGQQCNDNYRERSPVLHTVVPGDKNG